MSDYPDHFGQPGFRSYGTLTQIHDLKTIAGGGDWDSFDISAKGLLYFCHLESAVHSDFDNFTVTFTIDGFTLFETDFSTIFTTSKSGFSSLPFACFSYIPETPYLTIGLIRPLPFASQIKLNIDNGSDGDIRILVDGAYAKLL